MGMAENTYSKALVSKSMIIGAGPSGVVNKSSPLVSLQAHAQDEHIWCAGLPVVGKWTLDEREMVSEKE